MPTVAPPSLLRLARKRGEAGRNEGDDEEEESPLWAMVLEDCGDMEEDWRGLVSRTGAGGDDENIVHGGPFAAVVGDWSGGVGEEGEGAGYCCSWR